MPPARRRARALHPLLALLALSSAARADPPRIERSDYAMQLFQGPITTGTRPLALGGAYAGIAEGVDATPSNAAAPAVREAFSTKWFDYDLGASLAFPGTFSGTDFDNHGVRAGPSRFDNFLFLNVGGEVQLGLFGACVVGDLQQFTLTPERPGSPGLTLEVGRWHGVAAYGFVGDQLVVGAGVRAVTMQISETGGLFANGAVLGSIGVGPELGVLVKPDGVQWRAGATVRAPVGAANVKERAGSFVLPDTVVQPWEVELGVALQAGPRPLNPRWINPHDEEAVVRDVIDAARARRRGADPKDPSEASLRAIEDAHLEAESKRFLAQRRARYANWPRESLLVVASLVATGANARAVAVESFLDQKLEFFGDRPTLSPRAGIESEPILGRVRTRVGTYFEPARFATANPRQHLTAGGEIRLAPFDLWGLIGETVWRVSVAGDVAPRYFNWSLGLGAWH